jgi:hypothetical protein
MATSIFDSGSEQGLSGHKDAQHQDDSMVREALWGKLNGFDTSHPLYRALQKILGVRDGQPALRNGRLYFRPISGDGFNFGLSPSIRPSTPCNGISFTMPSDTVRKGKADSCPSSQEGLIDFRNLTRTTLIP